MLQTECLHVWMIDDIETEVEEILVESCLRFEQGTDIEFQLVEYLLVDIAVGVDEVAEELVLLDGVQVLLLDFDTSGS